MSEKKRVIPLDLLMDYSSGRYKAAVLAIKAIRGLVKNGRYSDIEKNYNKVASYALKKVLEGEVEELAEVRQEEAD